jgi:hypothetical protein
MSAQRDDEAGDDDSKRADRHVSSEIRKLALRSARVREEGST